MDDQRSASRQYSYWRYGDSMMDPLGPVAVISQQLQPELADSVNRKLRRIRQNFSNEFPELKKLPGYLRQDYEIEVDLQRFNNGEGQATLLESVRGHDVYIITDVLNSGAFTVRNNSYEPLSPDEHYQDLVRLLGAMHGLARRVNVILPYLFESRRYLRTNRGSMDCGLVLRQLFSMGIANLITFDAHDTRVANAVPTKNFESFPTTLPIIENVLERVPDLHIDKEHFMLISPKETGISRAIYYATLMKVPLGTFYREHLADGSISKAFLGEEIQGRDVMIVDDMIDSSQTICECASYLKEHGAKRVFCAVSFAQFTKGYELVNQAYDFGIIDKIFSTNLIYQSRALRAMPWFESVDMSAYLASVIDALNHNSSLSQLLSPEQRIVNILDRHNKRLAELAK